MRNLLRFILLIPFLNFAHIKANKAISLEKKRNSPSVCLTSNKSAVATSVMEDTTFREYIYKQTNGKDVDLRAYFPESWKPTDKRKVIVFFHGGSWVIGNKFQMFRWCEYFASQGMVAISANYTLGTPQSCALDARSAMRWVRENATTLGIDTNEVLAGGSSAGCHIAMSTIFADGLDDPNDNLAISTKPKLFLFIDPALELSNAQETAIKNDLGEAMSKKLNPAKYNLFDNTMPPVICFSGTDDFRANETHRMAQNLFGKKIEIELWLGYKGVHGFADEPAVLPSIAYRMHDFLFKQGEFHAPPMVVNNPDLNIHDFGGNKNGLFSAQSVVSMPTEETTMKAINLINNSGFSGSSIEPSTFHSRDSNMMWQSMRGNTSGEIVFDLGQQKDINEVHIWNWNNSSPTLQIGVRDLEILVSSSSNPLTAQYKKVGTVQLYSGGNYAQNFKIEASKNVRLVKFNILKVLRDNQQRIGLAEVKFSNETTLGIESLSNNLNSTRILAYNFSHGDFKLKEEFIGLIDKVSVINLNGVVIDTIDMKTGNGNISNLPKGLYILRFTKENKIIGVEKYIKR